MVEKHEEWLVYDEKDTLVAITCSEKRAKFVANRCNEAFKNENYRVEKGR